MRYFLLLALAVCAMAAGVDAVKAEPDPEKRSALALTEADAAIGAARKAYTDGQLEQFQHQVDVAGDMTELSYKSLQASGKQARKSPKWFKRAEQKMLQLVRRIDSFAKDVALEDRPAVESLRKRVQDTHDQVLQDIMSKK